MLGLEIPMWIEGLLGLSRSNVPRYINIGWNGRVLLPVDVSPMLTFRSLTYNIAGTTKARVCSGRNNSAGLSRWAVLRSRYCSGCILGGSPSVGVGGGMLTLCI